MSNYKKILFTGGSGRFGKVFKKYYNSSNYFYPTSKELDICNIKSIERFFRKKKPKLVIHCAALSRPMDIHEKKITKSININIIGTSNLVCVCEKFKVKIIYFSTNYVYPGKKGNYNESSALLPINNYSWSKLGGEASVQMYKNSLILRMCMTEKPFIHKHAYKNFITNFIFHEDVVKFLPKLYKLKGIINIGGKSQSVYKFAKKHNSKIKGKYLKKNKMLNTSMNINKLKKLIND